MQIQNINERQEMLEKLADAGYCANTKIIDALRTALFLGKPLLIEGEPGAGKTSLAYAAAKAFELPLIRLQMYEGLTDDKILYDYDYQKQLLTLEAVRPVIEKEFAGMSANEAVNAASKKIDFYGKEFLIERPVLKSINGDGRKVLLIDEIDKAPEEVEYMFYEFFEDYKISIPQYGTVTCPVEQRPLVFMTSNGYRELSQALKRRCAYLYIPNKTALEMTGIIRMKTNVDEQLVKAVAACLCKLADSNIRQKPSVAEGIDWAAYLAQEPDRTLEFVQDSLGLLIKNQKDMEAAEMVVRSSNNGILYS